VNDAPEFVVHERTCVYGNQRLSGGTNVVGRQVGAVCELDVDQAINRNCRVSGKLDKGVEGEGEAVVEFVGQILQQTGVINCNVKCKIAGVDEIGIILCLGRQCHHWGTLMVAHEIGLYLYLIAAR